METTFNTFKRMFKVSDNKIANIQQLADDGIDVGRYGQHYLKKGICSVTNYEDVLTYALKKHTRTVYEWNLNQTFVDALVAFNVFETDIPQYIKDMPGWNKVLELGFYSE